MAVCTRCGQDNPAGFRFCGACAAPLLRDERARETRKRVTAVFCDVVGSTPLGERLDPEVLRNVLHSYFDVAREVVERHGGSVSKYIGDAVVAVFGVPRLHEDDPLRAVRAARELQGRLGELNLRLAGEWDVVLETRTGIATGEVVVADGDEAVLGDVMNTAARLETAAEPGSVLVSDETWQLVTDAVSGEAVDLRVRGKAEPVRAWRLTAVVKDAPGHRRRLDRPLVGRARELRVLRDALERAGADRSFQLVTVVGEPGIGKSRLVAELEAAVDASGEPGRRLTGRCLAYGDGIGLWPLAEAVKGHLGIDESSTAVEVRARLDAAVRGMENAAWLRARLAPLVGLEGEAVERDEAFTAWQRFLDEIAAREPLLLVLEDLHWADQAVLAFVQHLAESSTGVPLCLVCTARPELFQRHPGWAGGVANATTLALRPLAVDDTTRLVQALLDEPPSAVDATAAIVERCGGNPLFAEEYTRLLTDRAVEATADWLIPETVRAVIGARIDALPAALRDVLHDAAVVGKVFWAGGLAAIGGRDEAGVRDALRELARRELVRRSLRSTLPGDEEFSFWHDLVHEVVYAEIPRAERGEAHRRTAEWIEAAAGDRAVDRAELLAHHYTAALGLGRLLPPEQREPLRLAALRHLTAAARRALGLDAEHATRLARQGLDLAGATDRERAELLCLVGTSRFLAGQLDEARELLAEARAAAEAVGDVVTLGEAVYHAAEVAYFAGDGPAFDHVAETGITRLRDEDASTWFARLLAERGFSLMARNAWAESRELIEHALAIGRASGDDVVVAQALDGLGLLRVSRGDRDGLADLEAAVEIFAERGAPDVTMAMMHLGAARSRWNGPADGAAALAEAIDHATQTRNSTYAAFARWLEMLRLADAGAWDDAVAAAGDLLDAARSRGSSLQVAMAAPCKARVLALRGDTAAARAVMDGALASARAAATFDPLVGALVAASLIACVDGDVAGARGLAAEFGEPIMRDTVPVGEVCRILVACGATAQADDLVSRCAVGPPCLLHHAATGRAVVAEATGDREGAARGFADAAERWRAHGNPYELAHALAGQARCVVARGGDGAPFAAEAERSFALLGVPERVLERLRPPQRSTVA